MRILTGADALYFRSLCQLLLSAQRHQVLARCRVYDLGLLQEQRARLGQLFPGLDIRTFDFARQPPHAAVEAGTYAWKPIIISQALDEEDKVLWLDSACVLLSDVRHPEANLEAYGQYVPYAGARDATVEKWTHPVTLARLGVRFSDPVRRARQRAGGLCGFHGGYPAVRDLVHRWRDLALEPECIAPTGSTRANHRQDQSLLTLLLAWGERDQRLHLTQEEIDLNSTGPLAWVSCRNKVPNWLPLWLDPLAWRWHWLNRLGGIHKRRWLERHGRTLP